MKYSVRRADSSDNDAIVNTLQRNLPRLPHDRLFQWLYCRNPEGHALPWVAMDSDQKIIGVAAAFPRRMYHHGKEAHAYVLGDFCIDAEHRSLGAALALQRACLDGLSAAGADFVFDFPSRTMVSVYQRLGIPVNEAIVRHAKPLRADRQIAERVPVPSVARRISALANFGLKVRDAARSQSDQATISVQPGPWGQEFTSAAQAWSKAMGTCVARTASYLNWRYADHPLHKYEMVTARQNGRLCGYLLFHIQTEDWIIDDLLAEEHSAAQTLLIETVAQARKRGVHTVSAPWLSQHPGSKWLAEFGFARRESSPVVLIRLKPKSPATIEVNDSWYLSNGDTES